MSATQWTPPPRLPDGPSRDCAVDGCYDAVQARGWCHKHYQHWLTYGDPVESYAGPRPVGTVALVEALAGKATYRQIDYWIRTGRLKIVGQSRGSGDPRRLLPAEFAAIVEYVDLLTEAEAAVQRLRSGDIFLDLVAKHVRVSP